MYPPPFDRGTPLPPEFDRAFDEKVARSEFELPVLPEASSVILQETAVADWKVARVVDAVKRDTALAGNLLRIVNSPAFAAGSRIVSVQQAVTRLGGAQLRQLAVVIACESKSFEATGYEVEAREAFKHSLLVALFAREIARHRRANVEEAFLAGLLHDIGWPVAIHALVQLGAGQWRDGVFARAEWSHVELGVAVARAWKLPEPIAVAIAHHHEPTTKDPLAATVLIADMLAKNAANTAAKKDSPPELDQAALRQMPAVATLHLYPDDIDGFVKRGPEFLKEIGEW